MKKTLLSLAILSFIIACTKDDNNPFCGALNKHVIAFMDSVHAKIINIIFFRKDNIDYAYMHNAYCFDTLCTDYYYETEGDYHWGYRESSKKRIVTINFGTYINHQDVFDVTMAKKYKGKVPEGCSTDCYWFDGHLHDEVLLIRNKDDIQAIDSIPHTKDDGKDHLASYITNPYIVEELKHFITNSETYMFYLLFFPYEGDDYVLIRGSRLYDKKYLKGFFFYKTGLVVCYSIGDLYKSFVNPDSLIIMSGRKIGNI